MKSILTARVATVLAPIVPALCVSLAGTTAALGQPVAAEPASQPAAAKAPARPEIDITKQPTLYVVGYAHLDTQWRWTYIDTIREYIPNTLNDNFKLFEKYPGYVFNFSGSRRYKMMEEYYPESFQKLRGYVDSGRWFPCGSSVDENDANVPSAESLVRQVLYGNRYFRETFGKASDEYMLPDCFGFPYALPSVLAHCGIKGFSTQKLTWGGVVPIPFKVGMWEGPDGVALTSALDPGAYVGQVRENLANSNAWKARIAANGKASGVFADYHYFGTGDQGGAPDDASVAKVEESINTNGDIRVISGPADWLFQAVTPELQKNLPRYKGELMLTEHSAGSISSQAYMKRWNRKNELLAGAAEGAAVAAAWLGGRAYPQQKLEDAWYLVLGSQMHDILPGTSVPKAYDLSWNDEVIAANQFASVMEDSVAVVSAAMNTQATGTALVVYNPLSIAREDVVEADVPTTVRNPKSVRVLGPDGNAVAAQILSSTPASTRVAFTAKVTSVGFASFDVQLSADAAAPAPSTLSVTEKKLENERYAVKLNDAGDVASIYDKEAKRELLSGPARLGLHYENPENWPAWNQDWADRQRPAKAYVGGPAKVRVVESGPVRVAVEVTREAEGSTFVQTIRLASGGGAARVEFDNQIDWRSRERSLRAAFPLAVANPMATYDLQTGAIERGNMHPKQYEYPFHQWFDVTDSKGDYGVSVMSDSKFAADKPDDSTARLTLLYTPGVRGGYADQASQDLGRHQIRYALYGHTNDWRAGQSFQQAARLNQPMKVYAVPAHDGALGKAFSLLHVDSPNVSVVAIKKAETSDEIVVRLREHTGSEAKDVKVAAASAIVSAREVDGQEREIGKASVVNGRLVTDVRGYGLRAFAITLGKPETTVAAPAYVAVPITMDADVVSSNANRTDGAMDSVRGAYPAEQFPGVVTVEGVRLNLASTKDGTPNAMGCNGQVIELPPGEWNRFILIAAGEEDIYSKFHIGRTSFFIDVPAWTGYVGQWDRRVWPEEDPSSFVAPGQDIAGIEPGYVKRQPIAWYASHRHTKNGDALYDYSYLYSFVVDIPNDGSRKIRLPNNPKIKVFAMSVAQVGNTRASAANAVFDTLESTKQDAPVLTPAAGSFSDATFVTIAPALYGRTGAIRYTLDGSIPTEKSNKYTGPISLSSLATVKAVVLDARGKPGPVAVAKYDVKDRTAPSVVSATGMYNVPMVTVRFSEPLSATAAEASHYTLTPAIAVSKAELSADRRAVTLTLAETPEAGKGYSVSISGVQDAAPLKNRLKDATAQFTVASPVYSLAEVTAEMRGKEVRDVPGLPVKGTDPWTINMWVRTDKQPANRTILAGFGKCEQSKQGGARYIAKFANGVQFWAHNRDVESNTQLELNRWQMLTATYDGTTLRVYIDGKKLGEAVTALADDENVVNFAPVDPWDKRRQFVGEIKDFTIWNTALSPQELAGLNANVPAGSPK
jgi:alpha-mannosidase